MKKLIYIAFNKPYGILSQFTSDNPDKDSLETLAHFNLPKDIYACGRLDKDSEGLLLLTNDAILIDQLLNPKNEKIKTYWVQVENFPTKEALEKFKQGLVIGDYKTKPASAKILEPQPNISERKPPVRTRLKIPTCWIEVELTEGKNRQVRRMTAAIGHPTLRLIRKKIGKLELGDLHPGEYRKILKSDIL